MKKLAFYKNSSILYNTVCQTELGRYLGASTNRLVDVSFHWFGQFFFKTPEMGAQTTIYCATDSSLVNKTGLYYR